MATSDDYVEFEDDYGNIYYLDDGGNLRRRVATPRGSSNWAERRRKEMTDTYSPQEAVYSTSIFQFFGQPEFKPSPPSTVPDTLREWVEGKKA